MVLGRTALLEDLQTFLRMQRLLNTVQDSEVSAVQRQAMEGMCHNINVGLPHSFNLAMANSPGVLVHWKVLLLISATLNEEEREY